MFGIDGCFSKGDGDGLLVDVAIDVDCDDKGGGGVL